MKVSKQQGKVTVILETADELHGLNGLVEFAREQEVGAFFPGSSVHRAAEELAGALPAMGARGLNE